MAGLQVWELILPVLDTIPTIPLGMAYLGDQGYSFPLPVDEAVQERNVHLDLPPALLYKLVRVVLGLPTDTVGDERSLAAMLLVARETKVLGSPCEACALLAPNARTTARVATHQ